MNDERSDSEGEAPQAGEPDASRSSSTEPEEPPQPTPSWQDGAAPIGAPSQGSGHPSPDRWPPPPGPSGEPLPPWSRPPEQYAPQPVPWPQTGPLQPGSPHGSAYAPGAPWQHPYGPTQGPPAYGSPGTWHAPPQRPQPADATFGVVPGPRPGRVPWTWRDVLLAVLIAAAPIIALSVLGMLVSPGKTSQPAPTTGFALVSIVLTLVVDGWFVLWAWFFSLRKYRLSWRSFGFRGYERSGYWGVAAAVILGGLFVTYITSGLNDYVYRKIVGPVPQQNVVSIFPHAASGLILFIMLAVFIAPVLEETVFRGFIFQGLAHSWGPVAGALLSALVFGLVHEQLSVLFPIFTLGLLLAAAFYWTKSIYTNIAFHAIFNAVGIVAWWFFR